MLPMKPMQQRFSSPAMLATYSQPKLPKVPTRPKLRITNFGVSFEAMPSVKLMDLSREKHQGSGRNGHAIDHSALRVVEEQSLHE